MLTAIIIAWLLGVIGMTALAVSYPPTQKLSANIALGLIGGVLLGIPLVMVGTAMLLFGLIAPSRTEARVRLN